MPIASHLSDSETLFLETLILLDRSKDDEKEVYNQLLNTLRPKAFNFPKTDSIFSNWLNIAILSMSKIKRFKLDPQNIQEALSESVPLEDIIQSLAVLKASGYIGENDEGDLVRLISQNVVTANDVTIETSRAYYSQILTNAYSAITLPVEEREFQCFSLGICKEQLPKVKEFIRKARQEIALYVNEEGDSVYQINMNAFPIADCSLN